MKCNYGTSAIVALLCLFVACTKETDDNNVVVEPPHEEDTLAQFTVDTSDVCSAIASNGTYFMGSALTENEYMQVKVVVNKTGTYHFSTDTLNGYYFSDAGEFTDTGATVLTLRGHGVPVTAGNSKFSFGPTSVYHTIAVLDTNVVTEPVPDGFYMKGKFGDMEFNVVPLVDVNSVSYGHTTGSDTTSYSSFIYPPWPNPPGTGSLSIQKQFFNAATGTEADFKAFFKPGAYPIVYRDCVEKDFSAGIWIGWVDDDLVGWYVKLGEDQEGSYFKILGAEDGHRMDGKYYVKVKAKFTCKVYKETDSEMKQLKDVEVVSYFIKGR